MPKSRPRTRNSTKSASVRPRKSKKTRRGTRRSLTRPVLLAPMHLPRTVRPILTTSGLASTPVAEAGFKPTTLGSLLRAISLVYRCTVWRRQLNQAVHSGDSCSIISFVKSTYFVYAVWLEDTNHIARFCVHDCIMQYTRFMVSMIYHWPSTCGRLEDLWRQTGPS